MTETYEEAMEEAIEQRTMWLHALIKWQWIVNKWDNTKSYLFNYEEMKAEVSTMKDYKYECSLCDKYYNLLEVESLFCTKCPVAKADHPCMYSESIYTRWWLASDNEIWRREGSKQPAQQMFNLLLKLSKEAGFVIGEQEYDIYKDFSSREA